MQIKGIFSVLAVSFFAVSALHAAPAPVLEDAQGLAAAIVKKASAFTPQTAAQARPVAAQYSTAANFIGSWSTTSGYFMFVIYPRPEGGYQVSTNGNERAEVQVNGYSLHFSYYHDSTGGEMSGTNVYDLTISPDGSVLYGTNDFHWTDKRGNWHASSEVTFIRSQRQ